MGRPEGKVESETVGQWEGFFYFLITCFLKDFDLLFLKMKGAIEIKD